MTTPHPPKRKEQRIAPPRGWEVLYILLLLLALAALIYTWHDRATLDTELRAEYDAYIEDCRARCDTPAWQDFTIPEDPGAWPP